MTTTKKIANRDAADLVPNFEVFRNSTGSFWSAAGDDIDNRTGQMPPELATEYLGLQNWGFLDYVVYSYNTPIAWYCNRSGWHKPKVYYSNTTSTKHMTHLWKI